MGARILVADDSVTIQKVVELTFSKEDFVLIPVRSGEEAIRKAKEVQPDLILLDLVMPDKNGYEVCTALRAEPMLRAVPIIMLTGTFEAFDKEQGLRAGANDFLTKPFESQALISRVKQLLFARTVDIGGPAAPAPAPPAPAPLVPGAPAPAATAAPPPPPAEAPQPAPTVAPPSPPKAPAAPGISKVPPTPRPARPIPPPVTAPAPPPPPVAAAPSGKPAPAPSAPGVQAPPPPAAAAPAKAGEPPALELAGLELEPIPDMPKTAGADASRIPQSLSLDELLEPGPVPPPPATPPVPPSGVTVESAAEPTAQPTPIEALRREGEAVFDFTADVQGPSLPRVEVGTGEPAAPSVEDVRDRAAVTPGQASAAVPPEPAPGVGPLEGLVAADEPVFDLTADMQGPSLPLVEVGKGEPPELALEDLLRPPGSAPIDSGIEEVPELQLEPLVEGQPEAAVPSPEVPPALELAIEVPPTPPRTAAPPPGPVEIGDLVRAAPAAPPPAVMAEILATPAPSEVAETPLVPPPKVDVTPVAPPPPVGPAMEAAPPEAPLAPEMGALRQAVTERVAHELAKDLSSQLIERIERIVWEVVPDLAEILINREIERLRTMAEGKQPS
jgi:CheY-like chemotaxis protein